MNPEPNIQARLRTMQIIAAALLMGVALFTAFVVWQVSTQPPLPSGTETHGSPMPIITLMAAVMMLVNAPLAFTLPPIISRQMINTIARQARANDEPEASREATNSLLAVGQTTLIIGLALLEGASFFGCVAYLVERQMLALGVVSVGVILMLFLFPTEGRMKAWIDRYMPLWREARRSGGV